MSWQTGPKWSPDGSRIAFGGGEISVVNLADGSLTYLTNHPANDSAPAWSRDGRIAFVSDRDGSVELYVMDGNGSNPTRLTHNAGFTGAFRWSPDGSRIAFAGNPDGARELYVMAADGSNPTPVTHNVGFNGQIAWAADGSRIVFGCEVESGNPDICSINTDGTNFVRLDERSRGGFWRRVLAGRRKDSVRDGAVRREHRDRHHGSRWICQTARPGHRRSATGVVARRQPARLRGDGPMLVFR